MDKPCGVCICATTKTRHVIVDFDMVTEIITFEQKGNKKLKQGRWKLLLESEQNND